jgi:cytochrome b
MQASEVKVWDPLVRVFHWTLVAGIGLEWLTSEGARGWHEAIGYAALALVAVRLVWGVTGTRYARFAQFVRAPGAVARYASQVAQGRAPRFLGHNPLGGAMVVALLLAVLGTGVSGWLIGDPTGGSREALEELHETMAGGMLVLVGLHAAGVVLTGIGHGENLVRAMLTGRKRAPQAGDIE